MGHDVGNSRDDDASVLIIALVSLTVIPIVFANGGFNWFISICFIIDGSKMDNALLIMIMVWNFDNGLEFRQSF